MQQKIPGTSMDISQMLSTPYMRYFLGAIGYNLNSSQDMQKARVLLEKNWGQICSNTDYVVNYTMQKTSGGKYVARINILVDGKTRQNDVTSRVYATSPMMIGIIAAMSAILEERLNFSAFGISQNILFALAFDESKGQSDAKTPDFREKPGKGFLPSRWISGGAGLVQIRKETYDDLTIPKYYGIAGIGQVCKIAGVNSYSAKSKDPLNAGEAYALFGLVLFRKLNMMMNSGVIPSSRHKLSNGELDILLSKYYHSADSQYGGRILSIAGRLEKHYSNREESIAKNTLPKGSRFVQVKTSQKRQEKEKKSSKDKESKFKKEHQGEKGKPLAKISEEGKEVFEKYSLNKEESLVVGKAFLIMCSHAFSDKQKGKTSSNSDWIKLFKSVCEKSGIKKISDIEGNLLAKTIPQQALAYSSQWFLESLTTQLQGKGGGLGTFIGIQTAFDEACINALNAKEASSLEGKIMLKNEFAKK